jgi:homoserine O-acetyltransferase
MDQRLSAPARWRVQGAVPEADGSNVLLFFHALTGEPDPASWWPGLVGPGRLLDTRRWALVAPDLVPAEIPTPHLTTRAMAGVASALLDQLGVPRVRMAVGGSVGGMVALEWAATWPTRADQVVVFAAPAVHPAHATGWNHLQRQLLALGAESGREGEGLALARVAAMLTYRTPEELDRRFGAARRDDGLPQVASWLDHHGTRLVERFSPGRYRALLDAMDHHDVGRDRGGVATALSRVRARLHGVGIPGDLLYPAETVRSWVEAAATGSGAAGSPVPRYHEIHSTRGHDAFLLEEDQVGGILENALLEEGNRKRPPEAA